MESMITKHNNATRDTMTTPRRIHNYNVISELGRGSFGVVYKCENKEKEIFALKQLDSKYEKYIQRELDIVRENLRHDNIVTIYDYFTPKLHGVNRVTIVMEFCCQGDLNDYMVANIPPVGLRLKFMVDMSRGVSYLHLHSIVHRDLKPENVLLQQGASRLLCKIGDFGISRIKFTRDEMFTTKAGSCAYIAPEVTKDQDYTYSVDVYSLGLLYFAVSTHSVLKNSFGESSLIPGYKNKENKIAYLNEDIVKARLSRAEFLKSYFKWQPNIGELLLQMLETDPSKRIDMEHVQAEVIQIQAQNEAEEMNKELRDQVRKLRQELQIKELTIKNIQQDKPRNTEAKMYQSECEQSVEQELRVSWKLKESIHENVPNLDENEVQCLAKEMNESVASGNLRNITFLMKTHSKQNVRFIVSMPVKEETVLAIAARFGYEDIVLYLLDECLADIEQKSVYVNEDNTKFMATPLWHGAIKNQLEIVKILLQHGADINNGTDNESTPVRSACFAGHEDIVKYLVEHGADINKPNKYGVTCLMNSTIHPAICSYLIEKGAALNEQSIAGCTALHLAVQGRNDNCVKILLKANADRYRVNKQGDDCFQLAALEGHEDIFNLLCDNSNIQKKKYIDCLQLLGCFHINKEDNDMKEVRRFWTHAMLERLTNPEHNIPKLKSLPSPLYFNWTEAQNMEELDKLFENLGDVYLEQVMIKERILGSCHYQTVNALLKAGSHQGNAKCYKRCADLWIYAAKLSRKNNPPLHIDRINILVLLCGLIPHCIIAEKLKQIPEDLNEAAGEIFKLHITEIVAAHKSDCEIKELKTLVKHTLFLIDFLQEYNLMDSPLKDILRGIANREIKMSEGQYILHEAVKLNTTVLLKHTKSLLDYSTKRVIELLLECGMSVDVVDDNYRTPLQVLVEEYDNVPKDKQQRFKLVARFLVAKGAKIDSRNHNAPKAEQTLRVILH